VSGPPPTTDIVGNRVEEEVGGDASGASMFWSLLAPC
jgi:hypothetical protein